MPLNEPVLRVLGDVLDAERKLLALKAMADDVTKTPYGLTVMANQEGINAVFSDIVAKFKALQDDIDADPLKIRADDGDASLAFAKLMAEYNTVREAIEREAIRPNVNVAGILAANTAVEALSGHWVALKDDVHEAEAAAVAAGAVFASTFMASTGGRYGLGGKVNLFGGASVVPSMLREISVWHLLADAGIEVAAIWVPALVALGAFAGAAYPVVTDLYKSLSDVNLVAQATGTKVGFVNGAVGAAAGPFQKLQQTIQPGILEIWGDALDVAGQKTGLFSKVVIGTETVLDQWAARAAIALKSGAGQSFLQNTVGDLSQLGDSIGKFFGDLGDIVKEMPGVAHVLLDFGGGVLGVTGDILKAAGPLLKFGLAMHGAIIWGGLLFTVLVRLWQGALEPLAVAILGKLVPAFALLKDGQYAATFSAIGTSMKGLVSTTSLVALGIVAIAAAYYEMDKAATAFNTNLENKVLATSPSKVGPVLQSSIQQSMAYNAAVVKSIGVNTGSSPGFLDGAFTPSGLMHLLGGVASGEGGISEALAGSGGGLSKLQQQSVNAKDNLAALAKQFGGTANAAALMNEANITSAQITAKGSQNYAVMAQQIQGVITGYKSMGQSTGAIGNDLAVLNKQQTDQYTNMQKLNSAWDQQTSDMTGSSSAFDTYDQGLQTLKQSGDTVHLTLGKLTTAFTQGHAAIDGLSKSDIALNQAFQSQVTNGNALFDTWRSAGIASGQFTAGVKGAIDPLVRYAQGSKTATAELVGLAQEAGYQGPNSMQKLVEWLGNTKGALHDVQQATQQATQDQALLKQAMQSTGDFIAAQYTRDLQGAELAANGAGQKIKQYAQDVANGQAATTTGTHDFLAMATALFKNGQNAHDSAKEVLNLISTMTHLPKSKIIQIEVNAAATGSAAAWALLAKEGYSANQINTMVHPGGGGMPGHPNARGSLIPPGFPHDTYHALLTSGEAVVPAHLTPAVAPFLASHGVPGFASGFVPAHMGSYTGSGISGGDHYHISASGTENPDAAAVRIIQEVRKYKQRHGNQSTGIG